MIGQSLSAAKNHRGIVSPSCPEIRSANRVEGQDDIDCVELEYRNSDKGAGEDSHAELALLPAEDQRSVRYKPLSHADDLIGPVAYALVELNCSEIILSYLEIDLRAT